MLKSHNLKKRFFYLAVLLALTLGFPNIAQAVEPVMADYTSYPIFLTNSVTPNVLIILDNSGSMNFNAYGTWPGNYGTVEDEPFACGEYNKVLSDVGDDAEEPSNTGKTNINSIELDLGIENIGSVSNVVGLRFKDVVIPQGAAITGAYLSFKARASNSDAASFTIVGQDSDNAQELINEKVNGLTDTNYRPETTASVSWDNVPAWTADSWYNSDDIIGVIQEIVDRPGWQSGNAMLFKIRGTGERPAMSADNGVTDAPQLHVTYVADCKKYYGYFDPDSKYSYGSQKFSVDPAGEWDGNFLNWVSMRRVDVLRKVLMGGLATSRQGGGNQTNIGENPAQSDRVFYKEYYGDDVSPYHGNYKYMIEGGYIKVYQGNNHQDSFYIKVEKDEATEPEAFFEGNLAGVLQRVGEKAHWGNEWFNDGDGNNEQGGIVDHPIGFNMTTLITDLQNTGADTWTPLAEAYYVAMQYFSQQPVASGLQYAGTSKTTNTLIDGNDPYKQTGDEIACAKSFVILLTDGLSSKDGQIPNFLKNYRRDEMGEADSTCDDDDDDDCPFPNGGSDFLKDVALYARTNDLRPADSDKALDGDQNMILYVVYAFDDDPDARRSLQEAARNGGFEDKNGNNLPDMVEEYDEDEDGIPDTYFEAEDGYVLEEQLMQAITDILARASSGTAVSVLATSSEGEGTLTQAYFKPAVTVGVEDVKWVGFLHSLWVDSMGRLREDTDGGAGTDPGLVLDTDKIVEFYFDSASGEAKFYRYAVDADGNRAFTDVDDDGEFTEGTDFYTSTEHLLDELKPIWGAGANLAATSPANRSIYTYLDMNHDGAVDVDEFVEFGINIAANIKPYLGVRDAATWDYLGAGFDDRVNNLINFILGYDTGFTGSPDIRSRTIDGLVWKLGDIVHSTPMTIGRPLDNYNMIYSDESYQDYFNTYKNRESVVYVGANDGMLHAFLLGSFISGDNPSTASTETSYLSKAVGTTEAYGDELWAYIPQTLLPHLKWLADPDYTHVYYVDLKPRIVDARIFNDDALHPNGWGTVLLGGLNMGGKHIWTDGEFDDGFGALAEANRDFDPVFFAIDITDPHNPTLLWEKNYSGLGLSTSIPTVARLDSGVIGLDGSDKGVWYATFGSGPTTYEGTSDQDGRFYVVDLYTGNLLEDFTGNANAFMGSPITVDVRLNYNVDVGYIGDTHKSGNSWTDGSVFRLSIPINKADADNWVYETDPTLWTFFEMFAANGPVTAAPAASIDAKGNFWVYVGTGRYFDDLDKVSVTTQYMYGIKDPNYNSSMYSEADLVGHVVLHSHLMDVTDIDVFTDKTISGGGAAGTLGELINVMDDMDGWRLSLDPGERILTEARVLGGIVLNPTYTPDSDPCGFGGDSNLLGLYYETGTAYSKPIFRPGTVDEDGKEKVLSKIYLGLGMGSSVGLHLGREEGAKGYIQQSTGVVKELSLDPALNVQSGIIWWRER